MTNLAFLIASIVLLAASSLSAWTWLAVLRMDEELNGFDIAPPPGLRA